MFSHILYSDVPVGLGLLHLRRVTGAALERRQALDSAVIGSGSVTEDSYYSNGSLPSNGNNTVTVTFRDSTTITGEGSIRKVDADNPSKGLAGAVIKITGVDNSFTGTYVTGEGGYLTDVPWDSMPIGSYVAEEMTPPEG